MLFAVSGVAVVNVTNNIVTGANVIIGGGFITQAFATGVTAGSNKCDANNNIVNVTFGSC